MEIQVNEFTDESLLAIIGENRATASSAAGDNDYYPALACALQAQLILEYRRNRAEILSGEGLGNAFDSWIEKIKALIAPLSTVFGGFNGFDVSGTEPSEDEGAIDTAIRLLREKYCNLVASESRAAASAAAGGANNSNSAPDATGSSEPLASAGTSI